MFDALSIPVLLVFLGVVVAGIIIQEWLERRAAKRRRAFRPRASDRSSSVTGGSNPEQGRPTL
ncbi:hypothetical protein [Brevundimonas aurantiaca]|uniref:hypothetical protein n=1 Tax=Brevundimonas aurantiaca TaxID=74316 RepID=UPI002FDD006C